MSRPSVSFLIVFSIFCILAERSESRRIRNNHKTQVMGKVMPDDEDDPWQAALRAARAGLKKTKPEPKEDPGESATTTTEAPLPTTTMTIQKKHATNSSIQPGKHLTKEDLDKMWNHLCQAETNSTSEPDLDVMWNHFQCFVEGGSCGDLAYLQTVTGITCEFRAIMDRLRGMQVQPVPEGQDWLSESTRLLLAWKPTTYNNKKYLHNAKSPFRHRLLNPLGGTKPLFKGKKMLVVGAGPAGLKFAIEAKLLGADVTVWEGRNKFNRANVLKLWKFTKDDLKSLGFKELWNQFGFKVTVLSAPISYVQHALLRAALILDVPVIPNCKFLGMKQKSACGPKPESFDVVIDGTGARAEVRQSIDITANFLFSSPKFAMTVNFQRYSGDIGQEISGKSIQYYQAEFKSKTVQLENIVYYASPISHYVVATVPKEELLAKGVFKKDSKSVNKLLARENRDKQKMLDMGLQIAQDWGVPHAQGILGDPETGGSQCDVFEFSRLKRAEKAYEIYDNEKRVVALTGDSFIAPFWPEGTGANRAVLSVYHVIWSLIEALQEDGKFSTNVLYNGRGNRRSTALVENYWAKDCTPAEWEEYVTRGFHAAFGAMGKDGNVPSKPSPVGDICGLRPTETWD